MESPSATRSGGFALGSGVYDPLPSGRHALPEEEVTANQRFRLERAMLELAGERSFAEVAVKDVLERAGTSRRVFYTEYADKSACFVAAYESATAALAERISAAAYLGDDFRSAVRASLVALLTFLDDQPAISRALVIEVHGAGQAALDARAGAMSLGARALDTRRPAASGSDSAPSAIVAEGALGGIEQSIRLRLHRPSGGSMMELLPELTEFIVLTCLGPEAAGEGNSPAAD